VRVVVTGAAGFIGGAVCRRLAQDGDEPIGVDVAGADRRAAGAGPAAVTFMSRRAVFPNARAREELGWRPRVSLEEGMARTLGDRR
jgi:nucleoside-diphosphate-sugar epimerase